MLAEWRADGFGWERLEVWSVGHPNSGSQVESYAGDATSACFADSVVEEQSAYTLLGALPDDLIVIDSVGIIRHHVNTHDLSLDNQDNRATLDDWVRGLFR